MVCTQRELTFSLISLIGKTGNLILLALAVAQLRPMYPDLVYPKACIISLALSWSGSYVRWAEILTSTSYAFRPTSKQVLLVHLIKQTAWLRS